MLSHVPVISAKFVALNPGYIGDIANNLPITPYGEETAALSPGFQASSPAESMGEL